VASVLASFQTYRDTCGFTQEKNLSSANIAESDLVTQVATDGMKEKHANSVESV